MEIAQTQQQPQFQQSARSAEATSALSSDFETFLKMLTTQMENQDPLNPIESADFAVQLATFSSVEQQVQTNDLLRALSEGLGASGVSQLAGWVGMEARVSGPAHFEGAPISLAPSVEPGSQSAVLVVKNERGAVMSREAFPVGEESLLWAGVDNTGQPLPSGRYTFEVESIKDGEVASTRPVEHYGLVREARLGAQGVEIVLSGGLGVQVSEVTALRTPTGQV